MRDTSELAIDREAPEQPPQAISPAARDAELMRQELEAVIASPDFARAPIMKRLLSFLVGETAAGRGDQLKAYSVAVDGLGRAPDYDARADSYPRVQVGRLRRMLDSYYAGNLPGNGLRLAIPSGRYRVALHPLAIPAAAAGDATAANVDMMPAQPLAFGWQVALLMLMLVIGTAALLRILPMRNAEPNAGRERPVLQLGGVTMADRSELGNMVRATLINGLGRSGMFDLRPIPRSGVIPPGTPDAAYRLGSDLVGGDKPRLFLRLTRSSPERLIWSGDFNLPAGHVDSQSLDHALAPAIATIARVNGLIATHELQEHSGLEAAGYSCLLLYHRYRKERTQAEFDHVSACLERSLRTDPNNAELQAAAAQIAIENMVSSDTDPRERPALLLTARRHAQISATIDPQDPWSNLARARVALLRRACPQSVAFAIRASQLQPYDPALLSDVGLYLLDCSDPRAEEMIRRAIALDDNPEGRFYAPLLLLAIKQGNPALAREALVHMSPPLPGRNGRFFLLSAAGYAMIGDLPHARAAWSQLVAINAATARDPEGFLERLGYGDEIRARAMDYLRRARLITS